MTDDFAPPIAEDLDASGRDLIRMFAKDRVYLTEVLEGLGLPDLAAVWNRMRARRLIGEPLPQTRTREEVIADLRRRDAEIDARYRATPIAWGGPLDTEAQIVAAAIAMQREIEADRLARFRSKTGADTNADADHSERAPDSGADDD